MVKIWQKVHSRLLSERAASHAPQAHPSRLCILSTWKAFSEDMHEAYSSLAVGEEAAESGTQRSATTVPSTHRGIGSSGSLSSGDSDSSSGGGEAPSRSSSPGTIAGKGGREGRGKGEGAPSGRRRVGGGTGDRLLASPEREAQREAELEILLSGGPPARHSETASSLSDALSREGTIGGGHGGGEGLQHLREGPSAGSVDEDSTDRMLPGTVGIGLVEKEQHQEGEKEDGESFWATTEGFRHVLVTGVFLGLSYVIAMSLDDLGVLLEVSGRNRALGCGLRCEAQIGVHKKAQERRGPPALFVVPQWHACVPLPRQTPPRSCRRRCSSNAILLTGTWSLLANKFPSNGIRHFSRRFGFHTNHFILALSLDIRVYM